MKSTPSNKPLLTRLLVNPNGICRLLLLTAQSRDQHSNSGDGLPEWKIGSKWAFLAFQLHHYFWKIKTLSNLKGQWQRSLQQVLKKDLS